MAYKVVPFKVQMLAGEGADKPAAQLEQLVNQYAETGWVFQGLEAIDTLIVTPGSNGCLGIGARPEFRNNVVAYVAVFVQR